MKNIKPKRNKIIATIVFTCCIFGLTVFSCIQFKSIELPDQAARGETFNLTVSIIPTGDQKGTGQAYLSLMIPDYFTIDTERASSIPDSGEELPVGQFVYRFYNNNGTYSDKQFFYSEALVKEIEVSQPREDGYYWVCYITDDKIDGAGLKEAVAVIPIKVNDNTPPATYGIRIALDEATDDAISGKGFGKGDEVRTIEVIAK